MTKGKFFKLGENTRNWCPFGKASMEMGKEGEQQMAECLLNAGYNVYDVAEHDDYQNKDTDFIIEKDGAIHTIEVKAQASSTKGKIWIEDILNVAKGMPGWIHYCEADYMVNVAVDKGFIIFKVDEMKTYLEKAKEVQRQISNQLNDFSFDVELDYSVVDTNYLTTDKYQEDHDCKFKDSFSYLYLVDFEKYAQTGRFCEKHMFS